MSWEVVYTEQAAVELLETHGPALGRPLGDTITGSRHPNMKELRVGSIRALLRSTRTAAA